MKWYSCPMCRVPIPVREKVNECPGRCGTLLLVSRKNNPLSLLPVPLTPGMCFTLLSDAEDDEKIWLVTQGKRDIADVRLVVSVVNKDTQLLKRAMERAIEDYVLTGGKEIKLALKKYHKMRDAPKQTKTILITAGQRIVLGEISNTLDITMSEILDIMAFEEEE